MIFRDAKMKMYRLRPICVAAERDDEIITRYFPVCAPEMLIII